MGVRVYESRRRTRPGPAHTFITKFGDDFRVHSPVIVDGTGGVFLIGNLSPETAIVTMPGEVVGPGIGSVEVPPHCIAEFDLISGAGGAFTYSVVVKVAGRGLVSAHGSSDPVIIIDPPCP
jgi:hypothetical protein